MVELVISLIVSIGIGASKLRHTTSCIYSQNIHNTDYMNENPLTERVAYGTEETNRIGKTQNN